MTSEERREDLIEVGFDFIPNALATDEGRREVADRFRRQFEQALPEALNRYSELPATMMRLGPFVALLDEVRKHYAWGRFHSCIVMSGVAAERILKDLLLAALRVPSGGVAVPVPQEAAKHLERLALEDVREFLVKSGRLDKGLRKAAQELARLRNTYAHAAGGGAEADARTAVRCLHEIVEGTVSVFKDYEIVDGVLVPRQPGTSG
jgi:hypothetical protein